MTFYVYRVYCVLTFSTAPLIQSYCRVKLVSKSNFWELFEPVILQHGFHCWPQNNCIKALNEQCMEYVSLLKLVAFFEASLYLNMPV